MTNKKLVDEFIKLVQIDSPSGEEDNVRDYIQARLKKYGFNCSVDKSGNLYAHNHAQSEPVLIGAHMDTVEPGRGIKPQLKDGYLASDGTTILGADNKACIAAILCALEQVSQNKLRSIELVFSVREETDGGINQFDFSQLKSTKGVIADSVSSVGTIITASPWAENLDIRIQGKSAHASKPHQAINALVAAATAIASFRFGHLDSETIANIGLIKGGDASNTIPGWIEMHGEIRSFSKSHFENAKKALDKHFKQVVKNAGANIETDHRFYCTGYTYAKSGPAIAEVTKIYNSLGITPNFVQSFAASDGNTFAANGISVINIGDGVENPHTVNEKIAVKDLEFLYNFFQSYFVLN